MCPAGALGCDLQVQRLLAAEIDYKSKHPQQFNIESYYHANHRVSE